MSAEPTKCGKCGAQSSAALVNGLCPQCFGTSLSVSEGTTLAAQATIRIGPEHIGEGGNGVQSERHSFGDYELISEIARGGMGIVYKARQISLNRVVAIKMILGGQFADPDFVKRFRSEAEAAANLRHPNIIGVYEIGEEQGQHFFSMEYVAGRD